MSTLSGAYDGNVLIVRPFCMVLGNWCPKARFLQ